jgi:hypothetical protein
LLRDLKAVYDADPNCQSGAQAMPTTLTIGLRDTCTARDNGAQTLPVERSFLRAAFAGAISQMRQDSAAATPLHQRGLTLADRFDSHRDMILRFMQDLSVPLPTTPPNARSDRSRSNNAAVDAGETCKDWPTRDHLVLPVHHRQERHRRPDRLPVTAQMPGNRRDRPPPLQ